MGHYYSEMQITDTPAQIEKKKRIKDEYCDKVLQSINELYPILVDSEIGEIPQRFKDSLIDLSNYIKVKRGQ